MQSRQFGKTSKLLGELLLAACCIGVCASTAPAQAPPAEGDYSAVAGDVPALRSTARDVLLDIVVTDRNGRTVRNVAPGDFIVKEDGVEQSSHMIETPTANGAAEATISSTTPMQAGKAASQTPAPQAAPRMRTLILLDQVNVKFFDLAFARKRLDSFLASEHGRDQPIGIMALNDTKLVLVHDFTTDRDALRASLRALPPSAPATANAIVDEYTDFENFKHSISALETIGRSMQGSSVRTNCVWITSGFLTLAKLVNSPEVQENFEAIMQHTANLYLGARLAVYTIDPHGVQVESSLPNHDAQPRTVPNGGQVSDIDNGAEIARQTVNMTSNSAVVNSFLGQLDERTGGRGYSNQNDIDVPLSQALDDASGSYLLAYTPTNRNFNGEYRRIRVTLRTPGLHARTRDGYLATDSPRDNSPEAVRKALQYALESPLLYHALQTHATLARAPHNQQVVQVAVAPSSVEWVHAGEGGNVAQVIAVAAYAANGKPLYTREYNVTTSRPSLDSNKELSYTLPVTIPAQTARVRLAIVDRLGSRIGTTDVVLPASP